VQEDIAPHATPKICFRDDSGAIPHLQYAGGDLHIPPAAWPKRLRGNCGSISERDQVRRAASRVYETLNRHIAALPDTTQTVPKAEILTFDYGTIAKRQCPDIGGDVAAIANVP